MAGDPDDELARTATAPGSASPAPAPPPAEPLGPTLGRYRLERELGAGGMGVVHAAFDPDLERRVALKVLRSAAGTRDARQRLLREARAMARLAHPNVVTVHEVGSANGRDYVAMEIIEGHTLADWLRATPRLEVEIVDAFLAAGRGLAAAHAAGIVHRDFKPHNVLRHHGGRIVVTDFGLAREAQVAPDPLAVTAPAGGGHAPAATGPVGTSTTPSTPLAGLTVTGSLLGTPAYMAPEQWSGGAVTPATDQFAFCVALWEALAGERPFKGATVEALRAEIERGPEALDASNIPRWLRPALLRGLARDPARRWPSMDALLAAMTPARRTNRSALLAVASAAVVGAALVYAIVNSGDAAPAAAPACRAPAVALAAVWPTGAAERLAAAGQAPAAKQLAADAAAWQAARTDACAVAPEHREPRLACLDGVLARFDAVARGVEGLGRLPHADAGAFLIAPSVCASDAPPRLLPATAELATVIATLLRERSVRGRTKPETAQTLVAQVRADPCASALAAYLKIGVSSPGERERELAVAAEQVERCADDRVRADAAIMSAQVALESALLGAGITSKLRLAELTAERVSQPDLIAAIDALRVEVARRADEIDEAIARADKAMAGYAARGRTAAELEQGIAAIALRRQRATPADLAAVQPTLEGWRARAIAELGAGDDTVRALELALADWRFSRGDAVGAQAELERLLEPEPNDPARPVRGRVVDARGAPVAGAQVAVGERLAGNEHGFVLSPAPSMRLATTGPDGTFAIPDAPEHGVAMAGLGALRATPQPLAETLTLTLAPTTRIAGRVELRGTPPTSVIVVAMDPTRPDSRFAWVAPVQADGSFSLGGVPRGRLRVFTTMHRGPTRTGDAITVTAGAAGVEGVKLVVAASSRAVHVVVRSSSSSPIVNAAVLVISGTATSLTAAQLRRMPGAVHEKVARPIEGESAPKPVIAAARSGDLFATMTDIPAEPASACAIAFPADLADPTLAKKIETNLDRLVLQCVPIPAQAEVVVVEVPPFPRLD